MTGHDSRNMRRQRSKWAVKHLVKHLVKPCETFNMFNNDEVSNCMKYEECGILPTVFTNCQCHMTWHSRRSSKPCRLCPSVQVGRQDGHGYLVRISSCKMSSKCDMNDSESQRCCLPQARHLTASHSRRVCKISAWFRCKSSLLRRNCNKYCNKYCNSDPVLSRSNVLQGPTERKFMSSPLRVSPGLNLKDWLWLQIHQPHRGIQHGNSTGVCLKIG